MTLPTTAPIILLGMHRSGTSLVARLLDTLGVQMGLELDRHHEAWSFKRINNELLTLAGAHWAHPRPFLEALEQADFRARCRDHAAEAIAARPMGFESTTEASLWGWKDPRNTLTLPIWRAVFPAARVVYIERNATDVALSLHRRELRRWVNKSDEKRMLPPTLGACGRLWKIYVEKAREHAEKGGDSALSVRYETLLMEPVTTLEELIAFCAVTPQEGQVEYLAREHIRQPTPTSRLESLRIAMLLRTGLLEPGIFGSGSRNL